MEGTDTITMADEVILEIILEGMHKRLEILGREVLVNVHKTETNLLLETEVDDWLLMIQGEEIPKLQKELTLIVTTEMFLRTVQIEMTI